MNIPIRDKAGNIVGSTFVPMPSNPVIDFNRTNIDHGEGGGRNGVNVTSNDKDVNLGVTRIIPTNQAYYKNVKPQNVL